MAYLKALWNFPQPFVADPGFQLERGEEARASLNPALPAVPEGLRVALVRRMLLIDSAGEIVPSSLVQSVQLRTLVPVATFAEWRMSRAALFAGESGGLRAVGAEERDFVTFSSHGFDPFERTDLGRPPRLGRILDGCATKDCGQCCRADAAA